MSLSRLIFALLTGLLFLAWQSPFGGNRPVQGQEPDKRVPWTTSRVKGSPEPPNPYRVERAFPKLTFRNPLLLTMAPIPFGPGGDRFFVGEQGGKIVSFVNDQSTDKTDLFIDVSKDLDWDKATVAGLDSLYGLVFHPQFAKNRYCYICYVVRGNKPGQIPEGTRVSRFRVTDTVPPRCDPKSEKILLTWVGGGHNGGDLHFGNDGFLYISTGDATDPLPPDGKDTGQDISDLLGSILRIDVDREDIGSIGGSGGIGGTKRNYSIPKDNPFIKTPKARPEVWAYGFRNPWRMGFDRPTGDLWVGDVGWELWEMIYKVKSGGNYGWSVMEGPQSVRPNAKRGPTPILPPAIALEHTEAASITGGFVYRGKRLKELFGTYIYGDWVTRKLWGTKWEGDKIVSHQELAQGNQRVIAFGMDQHQELYFLHHDEVGTLHHLVPNEAVKDYRPDFPRKLSETGLFAHLKNQVPAPGVYPFRINATQWADHAVSEHFVALPETSAVKVYDGFIPIPEVFFGGQVFLPNQGVLVKTLSMEMVVGNPASQRRLETQLLHFDGKTWRPYTYAWNEAQTDADLVPSAGMDRALTVMDANAPMGKREQTWHFPSRAQCITCHNPWVGYALAFNPLQLNQVPGPSGQPEDQIGKLKRLGLVELFQANGNKKIESLPSTRLNHSKDAGATLADQARSYLHVNCAHCHQPNAGGTAAIDLRKTTPVGETKTVGVVPVQGTFQIPSATILSPRDPYGSTLYYRMAKTGPGHMPHLGSELVDEKGLGLVHDWIQKWDKEKESPALLERNRMLDALLGQVGSKDPNQKSQRQTATNTMLSSTSGALMLARALEGKKLPEASRAEVLAMASTADNARVRDLFERFLPGEMRIKRLGTAIQPERILGLTGDVNMGRGLFFKADGLKCATCHRIDGVGSTLGPDLGGIGKKFTRAQILESLWQPSKTIEPQYATYMVETADGKVFTGLLARKNDRELVLRTAQDTEIRLDAKAVVLMETQKTSQMPEMLLRDLTAEQAAALVDFLAAQKNAAPKPGP